jgi:hypothetical protein
MDQDRPRPYAVRSQLQLRRDSPEELRKDDVNGNGVSIQTIHSWTEDHVAAQPSHAPIPPTADVVRGKPPQIIEKMGPTNLRYSVPYVPRTVQILYALAIDMKLELR